MIIYFREKFILQLMYLNGEVEGLTYDVSDNIDDYSNRIVKAQIARDLSLNWKSEHLVDSPTPHQNKKKCVKLWSSPSKGWTQTHVCHFL